MDIISKPSGGNAPIVLEFDYASGPAGATGGNGGDGFVRIISY